MKRRGVTPIGLSLSLSLVAACGDTGQPPIHHPAFGVGTAAGVVAVGDYDVTLEVARVAFGPAVFCASRASSDEQCPAALAELAEVATFDALSPAPQPLGTVHGFVGTVRSAGYGYGILWTTTQLSARPASGAVGGHSAHLEGTATSRASGATFRFVADVDVVPRLRGQHAVSASALDSRLDERTARLEVRLDPTRWLAQVNFDDLALGAAEDGAMVRVERGTPAANALIVGMTTLAPPAFRWSP